MSNAHPPPASSSELGPPLDNDLLAPPPASDDPPPPYPVPRRTRRVRRPRVQQVSANDSDLDGLQTQVLMPVHPSPFPSTDDANEATPLLGHGPRRRTLSQQSSASLASSIAATVFSLFRLEPDEDEDCRPSPSPSPELHHNDRSREDRGWRGWSIFSRRAWRRYFGVLRRRGYWLPLFHLMVLNFPYALAAWVFLFVFTVCGTALLVALPLGAVLSFFDLIGARLFARGELVLQSTFHNAPPPPPRPIFVRPLPRTQADTEIVGGEQEWDKSFYRNTYALFTDPTSYTALFYFLVIKPALTLLLSVILVVVVPASFVMVLPAPGVLVAVRRVGRWQAGVAVEGLAG